MLYGGSGENYCVATKILQLPQANNAQSSHFLIQMHVFLPFIGKKKKQHINGYQKNQNVKCFRWHLRLSSGFKTYLSHSYRYKFELLHKDIRWVFA